MSLASPTEAPSTTTSRPAGLTRGFKIAIIVALVWAALWSMGAVLFWRAANGQRAEAAYLARPLTGALSGTDVRLEGSIAPGETVASPLSGENCVAAGLTIAYVSSYSDAQNKTQFQSSVVGRRQVGPASVAIETGNARVTLPLANWNPDARYWRMNTRTAQQLEPRFAVPPEEIARARAETSGHSGESFSRFELTEWTLRAGMPVFLAGRLGPRDATAGAATIEPSAALGTLVFVPGTQRAFVDRLESSSAGLRIASGVFVGLALLPLLVIAALAIRASARA